MIFTYLKTERFIKSALFSAQYVFTITILESPNERHFRYVYITNQRYSMETFFPAIAG